MMRALDNVDPTEMFAGQIFAIIICLRSDLIQIRPEVVSDVINVVTVLQLVL